MGMPERVCVYAASSGATDEAYLEAARELGRVLAVAGSEVVYGGGGAGSMGALADGALAAGGRVTGVLPRFMDEIEWGHRAVSEMVLVDTMHERKQRMLELSGAVVALPGGCGTFEELFEAITWKRLGLWGGAVVMVDVLGYYRPVAELLERCVEQRFMRPEHRALWTLAPGPAEVPALLASTPPWPSDARRFARVV